MSSLEIEKLFKDAPEGTTHYVAGSIAPFEKRDGDKWSFWAAWNERWEELESVGDARLIRSQYPIIKRTA